MNLTDHGSQTKLSHHFGGLEIAYNTLILLQMLELESSIAISTILQNISFFCFPQSYGLEQDKGE